MDDYELVFFFQAEDGIRDLYVTGVQTCALPICYMVLFTLGVVPGEPHLGGHNPTLDTFDKLRDYADENILCHDMIRMRSEERRVGKECRSRGSPDQQKKKLRTQMPRLLTAHSTS